MKKLIGLLFGLAIISCSLPTTPDSEYRQITLNRELVPFIDSVKYILILPPNIINYENNITDFSRIDRSVIISIYFWDYMNRKKIYFASIKYGWLANNFRMYESEQECTFSVKVLEKNIRNFTLHVEINHRSININYPINEINY